MNRLEALNILVNQGCATWAMMPYHQAMIATPRSLEIQTQSFAYQIAGYVQTDFPKSKQIKELLALGCKRPPIPFVQCAAGNGPAFPGVGLDLHFRGG